MAMQMGRSLQCLHALCVFLISCSVGAEGPESSEVRDAPVVPHFPGSVQGLVNSFEPSLFQLGTLNTGLLGEESAEGKTETGSSSGSGDASSTGDENSEWLIFSRPEKRRVSFSRLPDCKGMYPLISAEDGIKAPSGLALDEFRATLFVADPSVEGVWAFNLTVAGGSLIAAKPGALVLKGVASKSVAVDDLGNLFVTDRHDNSIKVLTRERQLRGETSPSRVLSGQRSRVWKPAGVAVDSLSLVWTSDKPQFAVNSASSGVESEADGGEAADVKGVVEEGEAGALGGTVTSVSLLGDHIFFSTWNAQADAGRLLAIKKTGGFLFLISKVLQHPTSVASNHEDSLFIADNSKGEVFQVEASVMEPSFLEKKLTAPGVFGVSFYKHRAGSFVFGGPSAATIA